MDEQRYEINIKRFIQSTEYQLNKLGECVHKINEFQRFEDWKNVKQAQQNASQIIKRVRSDMKEMLKIRSQVLENLDDKSSSHIVNKIDEQLKAMTKRVDHQVREIDSINAPYYTYEMKNQMDILETGFVSSMPYQYELKRNDTIAREKDICEAYHQLQRDCEDLNVIFRFKVLMLYWLIIYGLFCKIIMQTFSTEIFAQKATIDSIEKNIVSTQLHVESGASSLRQALDYKVFSTAASTGAIMGTAIGGPVGFFVGAKIGAACAVTTGLVSYFVAKRMNKPSE